MNHKFPSLAFLAVCLLVTACSPAITPSVTQVFPTSSPTLVPVISTETPKPLPPMASAKEKVDCYGGPDENGYPLVATFETDETMEIVGREESAGYWIVMDAKSGKGCWVKGQSVQTQGAVEPLPILIPAPTVAARPNAPGNLEVFSVCYTGRESHISVILKWEDRSNNETGFVIYRNDKELVVLNANTTQYEVENSRYWATTIRSSYEVFAFNDVGNSARAQISFVGRCP